MASSSYGTAIIRRREREGLLGATVALVSSMSFRRFVRTLPTDAVPPGYWVSFGFVINLVVSVAGLCLAGYLLISAF
jgi:hypothetical protein